jgi:hypothetical protein
MPRLRATRDDMTNRTLMLNLYRSVYHFAQACRCADAAADSVKDWRFVMQIRFRQTRHHPRMKMTMQEHMRLTMLAIEGGWTGEAIKESNFEEYA